MKQATKHLLLRLIADKKESYENAIYSLNISQVNGYERLVARHQKKIAELESAKTDIMSVKE